MTKYDMVILYPPQEVKEIDFPEGFNAPGIDLIGMRWWAEKVKKPWWQVYLYEDIPPQCP